ncbi:hypothetical protein ELH77_19500 [Rhizobium ruizarguesonis]|uniref:hypothetical protein n=1 Tax=Rhizobium ruizarguesonis TaxID=2081791 RepID=UPI001030F03A|nr:hypothetical protein [Rhizobium ruizarguesonis]TAZ20790.1 hypothetical protein ELH77_19500 [Rhizobium ruizarguesonis]
MDLAPFLTFGGAILTAAITVIGTIYVARSRTKTDLGASITSGFRELTDQLQEERSQLSEIIRRQREELADVEKITDRQEHTIRRMRRRIGLLESKLAKAGLDIPPGDQ